MNEFIRNKHFCGVVAESFETKNSILFIRFYATRDAINSSFTFLYTAYRKKDASNGSTTCTSDEFDCEDDTCIDRTLRCDDRNNCKFKKDEVGCPVWIV